MKRNYIVLRFSTFNEGIEFMSTYTYPCSFIVDSNVYDKDGNTSSHVDYIEYPSSNIDFVITDSNLFIESQICYDGMDLFFDKSN